MPSWLAIGAYARASVSFLGGELDPLSLATSLGLACLVVGAGAAVAWREKQVAWIVPLIVLAGLAPLILNLAGHLAGLLGATFTAIFGGLALLLAIALIANEATRRLPVWLVGVFTLIFAIACSLFGFDYANIA
jgi:hypothetical protein